MIANNIKALYEKLNLTQEKFAQKIGFTPSAISQLKSGKSKKPSKKLLNAICDIDWPGYGYVNRDWLLTGKGKIFLPVCPTGRDEFLEKEKVYSINYCHADSICKKVCNACMSPNDPDTKTALSAVVDILQSGNETISAALKMNIKAFHEASQDKKMLRSIRNPNGSNTKVKGK